MQEGKVTNNCKVRIIRENEEIYKSEIDSLRREKDEVKEVSSGTECGIRIKNFNEFKDGDILECYIVSENTNNKLDNDEVFKKVAFLNLLKGN